MSQSWKWFGYAGHFCCARDCLFHLHTHVGKYCVSTVGEYHPGHDREGPKQTIGLDRYFETMVFELTPGGEIKSHNELEMEGYNEPEDAMKGHMKMCRKWARKKGASK